MIEQNMKYFKLDQENVKIIFSDESSPEASKAPKKRLTLPTRKKTSFLLR